MMKLLNLRLGLATNSSSTHSLIFLDKKPEDYAVEDGFGWSFFTASSKEAKSKYLASLLYDKLQSILPYNIGKIIFDNYLPNTEIPEENYCSIDHQSKYVLPYEFGSNIVSEEFFKEFRDYILQENLVILGGNDNDESIHPLDTGKSFVLPIPQDDIQSYVCRKDPIGNYWTFFRKSDGIKIRFSLNDKNKVEKAFAPELVDCAITTKCPYKCSWCSMGSNPEGEDANSYFVTGDLLNLFRYMRVFEVAFGGGEPTLHPDFPRILSSYTRAGIVANFTTRNLNFLHSKQRNQVIDNCGAFAYSLNIAEKSYSEFEIEQIKDLRTVMNHYGIPETKAVIHLVMGTIDKYKFSQILKACKKYDFPITLLGYKTTGRGKDCKPINYDFWLKEIKELQDKNEIYKISIDTVIAKAYEKEILSSGIPSWLFHTTEGTFSCFVDSVNKKFGKSSFVSPEEMIDLPKDNGYLDFDKFLEIYQGW